MNLFFTKLYVEKREYNARVMAIEKRPFTPIMINTTGGMEKEADKFLKRLVERLAHKRNTPYPKMASFVRKRMRFDLTKTIVIALRQYSGKPSPEAALLKDLDTRLISRRIYMDFGSYEFNYVIDLCNV